MRTITTTEELHKILLDIAKSFHSICCEEHIPYYMLGGTMLGAIRHNGFIPWDDDMDFGIPRPYFNKAKRLLKDKLPSSYSVLTIDDYATTTGLIKIANKKTVQKALLSQEQYCDCGVNIDIFPLDFTISKYNPGKMIEVLVKLQKYRLISASSRVFPYNIAAWIIKGIFYNTSRRFIIDFIENKLIQNKGEFVANYYGAWGVRETVEKTVFGQPKLYKFEDTELYGVTDYDSYLKSLYKNYMHMPSKSERHLHIENMYWK